jgi:hypothetical protein
MAARHATGTATADRPVFLDRTGIRRRWFAVASAAAGVLLLAVIAGLVTGFMGVGPGRLPFLPGVRAEQKSVPTLAPGSTPRPSTSPNPAGASAPTVTAAPGSTPVPTGSPTPTATGVTHGNRPTRTPSHPTPSKKK